MAIPNKSDICWDMTYEEYFRYYNATRSLIKHENTILNFRITWTVLLLSPALLSILTLLNYRENILKALHYHGYYYGFLLHIIASATFATACILMAGVFATTKCVRNAIRDWQEVHDNVKFIDGQNKRDLVPPVFSGFRLYALGIFPRFATALTCMILGAASLITANIAWPLKRCPSLEVCDLSSLIVGLSLVAFAMGMMRHHYSRYEQHNLAQKSVNPIERNLMMRYTKDNPSSQAEKEPKAPM